MKKNVLFAMTAMALLASCSKDASVTAPEQNNPTNTDPSNPNAPVLVQLGSGNIATDVTPMSLSRAAITKDNNWVGAEVGIYALGKNQAALNWTQDANVLLKNEKGTIGAESSGKHPITISEKYYPSDSKVNYTFYGYHPYADNPTVTEKKVTVNYTIDGTQDILFGKAEASPISGVDGYCAKYFRQEDAQTPNITFGHKLTRLVFKIKKGSEFDKIIGKELKVKSITLMQVPTKLDLIVANADTDKDTNPAGTLSKNAVETLADLAVKGKTDEDATPVVVDDISDSEEFGGGIMLFTDGTTTKEFKAQIELQLGETPATTKSEVTVKLAASAPFAAGTAYNVNVTVNSLQSVEVTATLTEWTSGDAENVEI